jgi:hypothetical protein
VIYYLIIFLTYIPVNFYGNFVEYDNNTENCNRTEKERFYCHIVQKVLMKLKESSETLKSLKLKYVPEAHLVRKISLENR